MDENTLKILLLGDSGVGKTCLMIKFTDKKFNENNSSTIGLEIKNKIIQIDDKQIKLNILDTAGQEKYRSITKNFIRNADGIIFVFDLSDKDSFKNIKDWLITTDEVKNNFQKILVGNKLDLSKRDIEKEKAEEYSENHGMNYFETSAKKGTNVELIFKEIAGLILSNKPEKLVNNKTMKLKNQSKNTKKHCCKNN